MWPGYHDAGFWSTDGVEVSPSLLNGGDGGASVVLCNHSGFTCRLEMDQDLGILEVMEPLPVHQNQMYSQPWHMPGSRWGMSNLQPMRRNGGRSYVKSSRKTRTFQMRPKDTLSCWSSIMNASAARRINRVRRTSSSLRSTWAMLHHESSNLVGCILQSERKCHASFARCKKQVSSSPPVACGLALLCLSGSVTDHTAFAMITDS